MFSIDVDRARNDTPGCANVIHFNNAGASLMPGPVIDALISHLQLEVQIGGYEASEQQQSLWEHTYDAVAHLMGCNRDEIAIIENATRAWDMAFYALSFKEGDRILTSIAEYASNYIAFIQAARKTGVIVQAVPNDEHGQVSIAALRELIDDRVKLIAITHVPTNGGLVNPAAAVGKVAREAGIPYLLDACQSVGQIPMNVNEIGCDILSATGRKFLRGPRATGFLYVRRDLIEKLEPPFLDLHAAEWISPDRYTVRPDARRFENWETYYAGKIALGVAIDYALEWGIEPIQERVYSLAAKLRLRLQSLNGIQVHDQGIEKCGIVSFSSQAKSPVEIRQELAKRRINVTVSQRSSTLLDMQGRGLETLVRASVHYYNTEQEIEKFCAAISEI